VYKRARKAIREAEEQVREDDGEDVNALQGDDLLRAILRELRKGNAGGNAGSGAGAGSGAA
jgi:hypothetical protein